MKSRIYNIGCAYDTDEVVFHLRSITVAEENKYTARYAEISDQDSEEKKSEQEYSILVDAIASWSDSAPTIKSSELSKTGGVIENGVIPADAVRSYFELRDADKERIAQQVVLSFRRKLQPKVVFY